MLENRAHDFGRHVAGRQLPSDLDADASQVKAGQVAPPVVAHCSDNRSSWFLADGFPYRAQHRRVQAFELLNGNRVRGFVRRLGRNVDAHFGFSLESFSLVVRHSHDAFLLRRQPLSHILMKTVMMLTTAQTMENQVAIVSM